VTVDPRSADLSADLCRTIGHLAQADGSSLLAAYHSSPVPLPGMLEVNLLGSAYWPENSSMCDPSVQPPAV